MNGFPDETPVPVLGCGLFGPFPGAGHPCPAPAEALEFDDERFRRLDRVTRLAIRGAQAALDDGEIRKGDPDRARCGIFLGNAYGAYETDLAHQRIILDQGGRSASPAVFTGTLPNVATGWVSIAEGLEGPMMTFAGGTTASAQAIAGAFLHLQRERKDFLVAGGAFAYEEDVYRVLQGARQGDGGPACEASAFLLLGPPGGEAAAVTLIGAGEGRSRGSPHPLIEALNQCGAGAREAPAVIAAGDATRDEETMDRLRSAGLRDGWSLSKLFGDLGEAAPPTGAVLAVKWLRGLWAPPGALPSVESVLVAGLDPCGRRAFALLFTRGN